MKALLTKRTMVIASIAALIAVVTIISVNVFNSGGPVTGLANAVSSPLRTLASQVARVFESIYSSIYRYDSLMADYEIALRTLTERESYYREANDLRDENERLRSLLKFRERYSGYEHEPARVGSRSVSNWSHSFIIDKGYANSGIQQGNGVATEYGVLIGQVSEVSAVQSIVISVLDTTFSAGAYFGDSGGTATAKGDFDLMRSGLLMLDHIDANLTILPGDSVVTSGIGGVFPSGLVVGEVVEVLRHSTGVGLYATVKPMRDIDTISQVFVITDFDITEQEVDE